METIITVLVAGVIGYAIGERHIRVTDKYQKYILRVAAKEFDGKSSDVAYFLIEMGLLWCHYSSMTYIEREKAIERMDKELETNKKYNKMSKWFYEMWKAGQIEPNDIQ